MGLMDELGMGGFGVSAGGLSSGLSSVMTAVYWVIGLGLVGGILFMVWNLMQYRHRFIHVQVVHGRKIMVYDKARTYKDKDGVTFWKTLKTKELAPIPPPDAIELDRKGKKCVRCYRTLAGDFIYAVDTAQIRQPPEELLEIENDVKRKAAIKEWHAINPVIAAFQPLTSNQRSLIVNRIKRAYSRTTKSTFDQIMALAPTMLFVVMIVVLASTMEKITAPALQANSQAIELQSIQMNQLEIIKEIKLDVQSFKDSGRVREAPPDQQ